jgi:hypothetical protein
MSPAQTAIRAASIDSFEGFLAEVEGNIADSGELFLFCGDQLRLAVTLLRHEKNPRVIWGLRSHEDWAFKATLLRFARGTDPVHLFLSIEDEAVSRIQGWVVRRTSESFWASPLPDTQTRGFWNRCLAEFTPDGAGTGQPSGGPQRVPWPEAESQP